jgi:hypothetical protein
LASWCVVVVVVDDDDVVIVAIYVYKCVRVCLFIEMFQCLFDALTVIALVFLACSYMCCVINGM